ncbi:MAG: hypothetical protein WC476_02185 [Phycisphaerae bacterium]|jgi:hypothetical protein
MKTMELKLLLIVCVVASFFMATETALGDPAFTVESYSQWQTLLYPEPNQSMIRPVTPPEWYDYVEHWNLYLEEGNAIPYDTVYCPPQLYVYEGNDPCYPQNDAGLVMAWGQGDQNAPDTNYSAAWTYVYGEDPDLSNCTITLKVYPPSWMTYVSFGLTDTSNRTISWSWNVPVPIPDSMFTTITINTKDIGLGTAAPVPNATSFASNPNFDINNVASFIITEDGHAPTDWGTYIAPPPGGMGQFYWNAWDSYSVTKNIVAEVKWEQLPDTTPNGIDIRIDDADGVTRHIADDFLCTTTGLITDIHFWGSWKYDEKCPINGIVASIYSDDPVGPGGSDPCNLYSKPDQMLWQQQFLNGQFTETLVYDLSPEYEWWWDPYFNVLNQYGDHQIWKYDININPTTAFRQEGNSVNPVVYWLALEAWLPYGQSYNFGWKTSREHWNDDAVFATGSIPPFAWNELRYPQGHPYHPESIDMAFAITTEANEPNKPIYKYTQQPDLTETGVDVDATLDTSGTSPWQNQILADDFPCTKLGPITDIHIWSSWYHDELPMGDPNNVEFTLSIHKDIPAGDPCNPNPYSIPGELLWARHFLPGQFHSTIEMSGIPEGYFVPCAPYYEFPGDTICWKYDFYIDPNEAFIQQGDPCYPVVYWLDVQARLPSQDNIRFGWKTSQEHWNDDAVFAVGDELNHGPWQELRYPPEHQYAGESMDLAFAITTTDRYITISGRVVGSLPPKDTGLAGVVMNGLPNTPVTDSTGFYIDIVPVGWSGIVTPTKNQWTFNPVNRAYVNVTVDQINQDYTGTATECLAAIDPSYADWVAWSKPNCWCYRKQCRGDINGTLFLGKPVTQADNNILKAAYNLTDAQLALVVNGICADLNHQSFLGKRVTQADNNILKLYYNVTDALVPECPPDNINFWTN